MGDRISCLSDNNNYCIYLLNKSLMAKRYLLIVQADWNDADYVHCLSYMREKEYLEILPIIQKLQKEKKDAIRRRDKYSYDDYEDCYYTLSRDEWDIINEYIPSGYEQSCHTITSIELIEINSKKTLY